ncbi:MAG: sensor histidine kinase, partial [Blautia producta]
YIGIMCLSLAVMLLVNSLFLEKFYLRKKTESLKKVYNTMNDTSDTRYYSSLADDEKFKQYCDENNLSMIVVEDVTSRILFAYAKNSERLYSEIQFGVLDDFVRGKREILEATDNYIVEKKTDDVKAMDSVNMVGVLDNGNGFLITTPAQSLKDSALISNVFYLYIGLFTIFISSVVIWFISRHITRPLQQLSELSKEMANLNFDAKYTSTSEDEIGVLGNNLNRMSGELEKTISELRTANNELQKDIEKKEQIDEMRKEFLSNVSHELKTPIALIQGYAEGLQECINDDQESREFYCDVIIDEAAKMNNMVKKLLSLNQLEFGNDTVNMERFDLTELVKGVVQSAQLLASQKEAEIRFLQEEPISVWGDEFKIEEVVTNYVSNALNHVDFEKKIEIKAVKRGDVVRLSVFNTGARIPEEDLDKIWIKFYKVDKARTREYGGSGIGLSIVKAIMDSMNQKCGVINYENGVEFWFELACGDTFC